MEVPKRGRGRPSKLPPGERRNVKCVMVNGEITKLRDACKAAELSQNDFTRKAVLHAADSVLGIKPATPKPGRKKRK